MEFSYELFKTDKAPSLDTKYEYELNGAFYDVYMDVDGGFHMDIKDKDSLIERIFFYENYISKEKYPVYTKSNNGRNITNQEEVLLQCLGLPVEVITRKNKDNTLFYLPITEILSRIHFEDDLRNGYGELDCAHVSQNILRTNHYSVIGAMNYLIQNGIFLQNLDRVLSPIETNSQYYPIHVDVKKIPLRFLEEETGDKLFMDFCSDPFMVTREGYIRTYKRIDTLNFEQKVQLAFTPVDDINDFEEIELRNSLKRYFFSICLQLIKEFYKIEYNCNNVFKTTVLEHDFDFSNYQRTYAYVGPVFTMFADRYYVAKEENGIFRATEYNSTYTLNSVDKKKLKLAYDGVKRYFDRHTELKYLPTLFLKMIGLPYPAYEKTKYFNFATGTFVQFIALLSLYDTELPLLNDLGYYTPIADLNGDVYRDDKTEEKSAFFNNQLNSVFTSVPLLYNGYQYTDSLFFFSNVKGKTLSLINGDSNFYHETLEKAYKLMNVDIENQSFMNKTLFYMKTDNGNIVCIKEFFELVNKGYSSKEAYNVISSEADMNYDAFIQFIYLFLTFVNMSKTDKMTDDNSYKRDDLYKQNNLKLFVEPENGEGYLIFIGRNFVSYEIESKICYAEEDRKYFDRLCELWMKMKFIPKSIKRGGSILCRIDESNSDLLQSFGFPRGSHGFTISDEEWIKGASIFDDVRFNDAINEIAELRYVRDFRKSMDVGMLLYREDANPRMIYTLNDGIDNEILDYYLNVDVIRIFFDGMSQTGQLPDSEDDISFRRVSMPAFEKAYKSIRKYYSSSNQSHVEQYIFSYLGDLQYAFYNSLSSIDDKQKTCFGYYSKQINGKKYYIASGNTFIAISNEPKLSSFKLLEKDIPSLIYILNNVFIKRTQNNKVNERLATYFSGIPSIMYLKLYELLKHESIIDENTLRKYFEFTDENIDINSLPVIEDIFYLKNNRSRAFDTIALKQSLLEDGLYVYPYSNPALIKLDDIDSLLINMVMPTNEMVHTQLAVVSEPKGLVKSYLKPDDVLYSTLIDMFINDIYAHIKLDGNSLLFVKEFLYSLYYENQDYLIDFINEIQNSDNLMESVFDYVVHKTKNIRFQKLKTKHINELLLAYLLFAFVLFVEKQIIIRVNKKIIKR